MSKSKVKNKTEDTKLQKQLYIVLAIVFIFWLAFPFIIQFAYGFLIPTDSNEFGDTYGALSALFTAFAFAFLIYTTMMQKEELKMQREELRLQREEMQLTRAELEKSAEAQEKLVELTQSQLYFHQKSRKQEITPNVKRVRKGSNPIGNRMVAYFTFEVRANPLILANVEIQGDAVPWSVEQLNDLCNKEYLVGDTFIVSFYFPNQESLNLQSARVIIHYSDIGGNQYASEHEII